MVGFGSVLLRNEKEIQYDSRMYPKVSGLTRLERELQNGTALCH
jgi:hypothetical protein